MSPEVETFLVTGAVRRGDAVVRAPALLAFGEQHALEASEATHAIPLPDPLEHSPETSSGAVSEG
ncbi:MAG: hypothetical protein IPI67_29700 [Myxococcales bacterium]|nr:hypothetical protein [Myxococcales bacterium]